MTGDEEAEAALAPFFAAARAEPGPSTALLNKVIADAAEVAAARAPRPAPAAQRRGIGQRLRAAFAPVGGWPGLAALGTCAAIGFWAGLAGVGWLDAGDLSIDASTAEASADPVADFFDLAAVEG